MKSQEYINEALSTLSTSWHGDKVKLSEFKSLMETIIGNINELDKMKKALLYKNDNEPLEHDSMAQYPTAINENAQKGINLIHAIIGIVTESGELLEALSKASEADLDMVNLKEETGDIFWYIAVLANEAGFTFEEAQNSNIKKLRARYPDKFSEYDATNRNLDIERKILEE